MELMSGPRRRAAARLALPICLVPLLAGCAALTGGSTSPVVIVNQAPNAAMPVAAKSATPTPSSPAPALHVTGTNWTAILSSLLSYGQWLLANPNAGLVANVATTGCSFADDLTNQLQDLAGSNDYVKTAPISLLTVQAPTAVTSGTGQVAVLVQAVRGSEPLEPAASAGGDFALSLPPTSFEITLTRDSTNSWHLCTVTGATSGTGQDQAPLLL